jgi:Xaa-Pro dipeptidase
LPNLERAETLLANAGVDFVIVSSPPNVRYFTQLKAGIQDVVGWWNSPKMLIYPVSREMTPALIVNVMDEWNVLTARSNLFEPRFYGSFVLQFDGKRNDEIDLLERIYVQCIDDRKDAFGRLDDFFASWGGSSVSVGFEGCHLPTSALGLLKKRHPSADFKEVDDILSSIRMIKTEEEVERMKRSATINIKGFKAILDEIKPGAKEITLGQAYLAEIARYDARPCYVMVNAGPASAALLPSYEKPYRVKKGDTVRIDIGCEYRGYCSDISRTVAVGKVSEEKRRLIHATTRGYVETEKILKPGLPIKELFNYAVSTVKSAGIPDYRRTNVGHGLGVEIHEMPDLVPEANDVLEKDMVINIETPYYSFGIGGFSGEETVRITESSYDLLTKLERIIEL